MTDDEMLADRGDDWVLAGRMQSSKTSDALRQAMHDRDRYQREADYWREQQAWQPIETAPTDGTPLLLFARCKTATAPIILTGWYRDDCGWIESSFTWPVGVVPTHWMPLPAFPAVVVDEA